MLILRGVSRPLLPARTFPAWFPAALFVLLIAADQWLKSWALAHLHAGQPPVPFLPGLLGWVLTFNTGAAWSMFSGSARLLAVGRILVGLAIVAYVYLRPQTRFMTVVLTMIAAGAVGNSIDGLRAGQVTDMLYSPLLSSVTRAINGSEFPIFNLADSYVVLGTLLLLVGSFTGDSRKKTAIETQETVRAD
ncbi:signal peptidase II [Deinococcus sp.]|uniref:signal peptidase II n=1 Tax=Deinococcus sp. TaxID=47478 RepID=UPI0025BC1016|nr:signal peptidase II [Deinococcus sp.]